MKKALEITLGIVTAVGGFLEIGSVATAAQAGASFGYDLLWARRALHTRNLYSLYRVPWQDMDLSDPEHPRLRISRRDLRHAT